MTRRWTPADAIYVQKPFDTVDLIATVRTLLEGGA